VIVINSTNIKENEQSPLGITDLTAHNDIDIYVGNPSPCLGKAQKCGGIKPVNGISFPTLLS
jgi:hypothetical protein